MLDLSDGKVIYDKVNRLREEKGWTLYKLAEKAGVSKSALYNWRDKESIPSLIVLDSLCGALEITIIDFLLDGDELMSLTEEQKTLLDELGTLTSSQRKALINLVKEFKRKD
ncbi:MAG: helix-turn-helix domain-containing protein [Clostridia bacterium]|nr:helix-turn-helix domain-containing protein [Clostridia bacterium]MDE6210504.1 helix-turn-helix domain-containing protein [Clostridia bacterium]MDE6604452.1 helix-turn-helix domain-containing protein [Clostridia bacterium]MDE6869435.1 helix-turn-helix domain-containing protein [Clostridia bacterium]MDE7209593.1 helix-turn-helix domain-containing protein [Clostridia bacterium]